MIRERSTSLILFGIAIAVIFAILYLVGCFSAKISATRAAEIPRGDKPSWKTVICRNGSSGWDYTCTIRPKTGDAFTLDVKVNGSSITDQSAP